MAPEGSPGWQLILLGVAALFVLWETWRGWRAGLVRSGLRLGSMVLSVYLGYAAAVIAAAPLGGFKELSGIVTGVVVGFGVCVVVFIVMQILSAVLFKKTDQQSSGVFRFLWGSGGAFFGFLLGMLIVWGGISIIRSLGTLAESREPSLQTAVASGGTAKRAPSTAQPESGLTSGLIKLKDSLEIGPLGKVVEAADPIPPDVYELIGEIGAITSNQEAMVRFLEYPDLQGVLQSPKLAELLADPSIQEDVQTGNFLALMRNPALLAAVNDPALTAELKKVDLRAALKFALEKPTASPSPSPTAKK